MKTEPESKLSDSEAPFGSKKRDMVTLVRVLKIVFVMAGASLVTLICYAGKTYIRDITSQQVIDSTTGLLLLPAKVQSLEEFRLREESQTAAMQAQVNLIFVKLSALETMQDVNNKNTERILRKLDTVPTR